MSARRRSPTLLAFAGRLEAARRAYGSRTDRPEITKDQFAQDLGIARATYYRYERGEVQPPLAMLDAIRRVTGVSLDWLVAGLPRGQAAHPKITVGDRLRWAREAREPWLDSAAAVMEISPAQWRAYEEDQAELPMSVAREFARRFRVSLDYLYEGGLKGMPDRKLLEVLLAEHPELQAAGADPPIDGPTPREDRRSIRPRRRIEA